jgi:hypothetical protein
LDRGPGERGGKWEVSAAEAKAKCEERIAEAETILASQKRLKKHEKTKLESNLQRDKAQLHGIEQYKAIAQRSQTLRGPGETPPAEAEPSGSAVEAEGPEQLQARMAAAAREWPHRPTARELYGPSASSAGHDDMQRGVFE